MNKEIFIKYFNNKCSDDEFDEFVSWVDEGKDNVELKKWSFSQWRSFKGESKDKDKQKYSALLDRIHHEINLNHRGYSNTKTLIIPNAAKWFSRAAAILIIPLLGVLFYLTSDYHGLVNQYADLPVETIEVVAPIGSQTIVQLNDGTKVSLNYGSSIKYPRVFHGDTREITLSGEGYFEVAHNPEKPFIVKTKGLDIRALGTVFNVKAYPEDNVVATTLVEGKVVIEKSLLENSREQVRELVPGQHLSYSINSGDIYLENEVEKYIGWKDGKLIFDNEPIRDIAEELERMFNVEIDIAENAEYLTYTFILMNDPLYLILDLMKETTPITYTILPRQKQSDGTFSKLKISIDKKQ